MTPRVKDNDRDEITVTLDGKELRGWSYENEAERRVKMLLAREFVEGWFQGSTGGEKPVAWVSAEQLASLPADPEDEGGAKYLPVRRSAAGKFQTPIFLPQAALAVLSQASE